MPMNIIFSYTLYVVDILGCGGCGFWSTLVTGEAPEAVEEDSNIIIQYHIARFTFIKSHNPWSLIKTQNQIIAPILHQDVHRVGKK